jgi:hypothetical protein
VEKIVKSVKTPSKRVRVISAIAAFTVVVSLGRMCRSPLSKAHAVNGTDSLASVKTRLINQ